MPDCLKYPKKIGEAAAVHPCSKARYLWYVKFLPTNLKSSCRHTILFVLGPAPTQGIYQTNQKKMSRHSSQDVFYWKQIDDIQLPSFNTHRPMPKKTVSYQMFPLNACPFRGTKCRDPCCFAFLVLFFLRKARGWYHCRTTWGQCSFYRTARWTSMSMFGENNSPPQWHWSFNRQKRYMSEKTTTTRSLHKWWAFVFGRLEFPAFQRAYGGNCYSVPVITISEVKRTSVFNSFGVFLSCEPRRKKTYFPLNPGCLIGILTMNGLW